MNDDAHNESLVGTTGAPSPAARYTAEGGAGVDLLTEARRTGEV